MSTLQALTDITELIRNNTHLKGILLLQKEVLRIIFFKNRRYSSDELFEQSRILNVYDLCVCELLKIAVYSTRGKIVKIDVENLFTHMSSTISNKERMIFGAIRKCSKKSKSAGKI